MAAMKFQIYANTGVAILIDSLVKIRKNAWQNEGISQNVHENKGRQKFDMGQIHRDPRMYMINKPVIAMMPECY
jgi:hypothetical protein